MRVLLALCLAVTLPYFAVPGTTELGETRTAESRESIVASVSPHPNSSLAGPGTELVLDLTTPVDVDAWDEAALDVFGRWSGVVQGRITLEDGGTRIRFAPEEPFQAGAARKLCELARLVSS